jgi:hypothetical protein
MSKYAVMFTVVIIGIMGVSETITVIAQDYINQTNSTKLDKQKIIVTWLELNKTAGDSPVISISSEEFWKIFGPLVEQSGNKTANLEKLKITLIKSFF